MRSKTIFRSVVRCILLSALTIAAAAVNAWQTGAIRPFCEVKRQEVALFQTPAPTAPTATPTPNPSLDDLMARIKSETGISVKLPKVYDDSSLQQMLNDAEARLASISALDQGKLIGDLGAISGASLDTSSFALSVLGPSTPSIATVANGATGNTVSTNAVTTSATPSTVNTVATTSGLATQNVTTTTPQANAPTVTAPAPTAALGTTYSPSSSDLLREQMQLTYEIANLRLLLAGAISDRLFFYTRPSNIDKAPGTCSTPTPRPTTYVKPRVTIGFPITLSPDLEKHKDAAAIVEVELTSLNQDAGLQPEDKVPTITAILPREKTYNVAAITDKSVSIGGGVVTQIGSVAGSFLRGHKRYYVVQDQDTVALTYEPGDPLKQSNQPKRTGVRWQFRPVLGQHYVRTEERQAVLQIAFASLPEQSKFGEVHVRTYWRKYDRKTGLLKGIIKDSLPQNETYSWTIPNYKIEVKPASFDSTNLEDLGSGLMRVTLPGRFLPDTVVRVGAALLHPGTPGFVPTYNGIQFVAPISDLATKSVSLFARDGSEFPLAIGEIDDTSKPPADIPDNPKDQSSCSSADYGPQSPQSFGPNNAPLHISKISLSTVDQTSTLIHLTLRTAIYDDKRNSQWNPQWSILSGDTVPKAPLVIVIGGRVFGYSDAPITRESDTLSAVVPTALITTNPVVIVKHLFAPRGYAACRRIVDLDPFSQSERLVLLQKGQDSSGEAFIKFLLYGSRLRDVTVVASDAGSAEVDQDWHKEYADSLRVVVLKAKGVKAGSQIVLQRIDKDDKAERPLILSIPAVPFPPSAEVVATETIEVGADELVVTGDGLDKVVRVSFQGKDLRFSGRHPVLRTFDGWKTATVSGLKDVEATKETTKTGILKFWFPDKEVDVSFEVVGRKVETVPRQ